jgi:hypothetical protein
VVKAMSIIETKIPGDYPGDFLRIAVGNGPAASSSIEQLQQRVEAKVNYPQSVEKIKYRPPAFYVLMKLDPSVIPCGHWQFKRAWFQFLPPERLMASATGGNVAGIEPDRFHGKNFRQG